MKNDMLTKEIQLFELFLGSSLLTKITKMLNV